MPSLLESNAKPRKSGPPSEGFAVSADEQTGRGEANIFSSLIDVRPSGVHGRGVYATQFIPEDTRIIEYTGQRVSWEDAPNDENDPHTFNFGLENGEVINPEVGGNDARWINHGCDPNCEAIEEDDRVFIYAMRDIEPGEELFYDYALEIDEPITEESKKEHACHCGSPQCRGTMLSL